LINITGGTRSLLARMNERRSMIQEEAHDDANIIFGAVIDENMTDEIRITVIATGFGELREEKKVVAGGSNCAAPAASVAKIANATPKNRKVVHLGTIDR
jgi:cell division protein FtsZ